MGLKTYCTGCGKPTPGTAYCEGCKAKWKRDLLARQRIAPGRPGEVQNYQKPGTPAKGAG